MRSLLRLVGPFVVSSTIAACTRADFRPDPPLREVVAPRLEPRLERLGKPCAHEDDPFGLSPEKCGKGDVVAQVYVWKVPDGWPWSPGVTLALKTGAVVVAYEEDRVTYTSECSGCRDPTPKSVYSVKLSVATDDQLGALQKAIGLPSRPVVRDATKLRAWHLQVLGARRF
jgi:hypothetical protein